MDIIAVILVSLLLTWNIYLTFFCVSIVDFEQVNTCRVIRNVPNEFHFIFVSIFNTVIFFHEMYSKFEFAIKTRLTRVKVLIFNRVIHKNNTGGIIVEHVFADKVKLKLWNLGMISVELLFCLLLLSILHHWK